MNYQVVLYALGANLCFALGSQVFAAYTRRLGSTWMNWFKASFALIAFILFHSLTSTWTGISAMGLFFLLTSGFIGLGAGDIYLLKGFAELGPGRTLMLFAFQPLILGLGSYLVFDQVIDYQKFWAILFFIICLLVIGFESYQKEGHWNKEGITAALFGMSLDAVGVLMTRYSFETNPDLEAIEGNVYRCLGAILLFLFLKKIKNTQLITPFLTLNKKDKYWVFIGSFLGTFVSLGLYLEAVKTGHLASISGIAITGTIFSSFFECLIQRSFPSKFLFISFLSFLVGMRILLF